MRQRLTVYWHELQDTLWFLPAIMTAIAAILALVMVQIDQTLALDRKLGAAWLFGGGAEGARGVLETIAGTMITVTGVVFSITIVALQLASSQFTPRVLRAFTGDRGNQVVLGAFIGAFTYALLVLRSVRSATQDHAVFVPAASVTLAIVLLLASIGCLIYFIHHAARSIQAAVVIDRAATDTLALIDELFPAKQDERAAGLAAPPAGAPSVVRAERAGYLQHLDVDALLELAKAESLLVRTEPTIGAHLLPGQALASIWPRLSAEAERLPGQPSTVTGRIRDAFVLGMERTLNEDLDFGFRQLADIALKALSPGINDPTTAIMCIDRLAESLVVLANRNPAAETVRTADGVARLLVRGPSFGHLVATAFGQIRHYGAGDATVAEHLACVLGTMSTLVPDACWPPLAEQAGLLLHQADVNIDAPPDLNRVRAAAAWAIDGAGIEL